MKKYGKILLLWFLTLFSPCALRAQKENAEQKVRKNDIKITLLSIGSGSTRLTYERAFTPRTSAELTVGIIGLGVDWIHHTKSRGYLLKLAYKWNVVPMVKANSPLAGFYLKPELVVADFRYALKSVVLSEANPHYARTLQGAMLGEFGYQLLLKWFVFDVYAGLGPTWGNGNEMNYYHGFMRFPKDGWLSFTSGFRLGVAF